MIELRGVTKEYDGTAAVRDLDLTVREGEVCALIGPSGCGKSTTLRLVNRMIEPTRGAIRVRGRDARSFKPALLRRQMGYVIQSVGLFPHMTVAQNIAVVPRLLGWDRGRIDGRIEELLALVGLPAERYRDKPPHELSGGEAQRIGVARALAADPPILLMDEPFGAVDPLNREVLQGEFIRIQKELQKTVVFVTHDLDEAVRVADRIVLMRAGRIVQSDTPENLLARPADGFVRNFIGADRALKRLVRFQVGGFMTPAPSIRLDEPIPGPPQAGGPAYLWVVSGQGRPLGWVDLRHADRSTALEQAMTPINLIDTAVYTDSTLKAALSRMLGQGIRTVPVVDGENRLVGEISLPAIERVTEPGESG